MKILFLSTSMGMGGADQQLLSAARELRARGHDIMIVSLTALGAMGMEARAEGFPTESLGMARGVPDPRGLVRLVRLVRAWRPDVIHSHMVHANLLARVVRLLAPAPALVSTIHNITEGGALLMAGYRVSNTLVDHMTIISQAAADRFIRDRIVPSRLLTVIPNGVDARVFAQAAPEAREAMRRSLGLSDEFAWLAVGRFELAKDYPTMLRAFAELRERRPNARLLLVGEGALQGETEALAAGLGLTPAVRFLGVRRDVPEVMRAADGYLMSSAWEGMPMVLLEAAAAALPIVTTNVGGTGEVVEDERTGFLVPARNPSALATAMERLMTLSEAQRRAMGDGGRERVMSRYSLNRVVERWEALYREVLERKGAALALRESG